MGRVVYCRERITEIVNKSPDEQASGMSKFLGKTGKRFRHYLVDGFVKPQQVRKNVRALGFSPLGSPQLDHTCTQGAKFGDHLNRVKATPEPKDGMGFGSAVMRSSFFRALSLGFLAPLPFRFGGLKILCNEPKE